MLSVNGKSFAQRSRLALNKYYLHIASESTVLTDDRGVMLSDLAAAHRCAVSVIWNCMRFDAEEQDWRGWHVKIADDTGRTSVIVLFPTVRRSTVGSHGGSG
jgi:hypothetical protein